MNEISVNNYDKSSIKINYESDLKNSFNSTYENDILSGSNFNDDFNKSFRRGQIISEESDSTESSFKNKKYRQEENIELKCSLDASEENNCKRLASNKINDMNSSFNSGYEQSSPNKINRNIDNTKKSKEIRYGFLINIRDEKGRSKDDPNYDSSTLYIGENEYKKFTSFERQFWDIKKKHYDTVIFFKKGKFYELYEEDADLASKLFDFRVTDRVNI